MIRRLFSNDRMSPWSERLHFGLIGINLSALYYGYLLDPEGNSPYSWKIAAGLICLSIFMLMISACKEISRNRTSEDYERLYLVDENNYQRSLTMHL